MIALPIPYTKRAEALIARQTKPIQQQYVPLTVPVECHLAVFSETGNKLVEAKYRIDRASDGNEATVEEIK